MENKAIQTAQKTELIPQIFNYRSHEVEVVMIEDIPYWVAKDVCLTLSLEDTEVSLRKLDEDEKLIRTIYVSGQNREVWLVNESGLYNLIFRSRKPEAKQFRKWVTSEVLPTLRKTGEYKIAEREEYIADLEYQNFKLLQSVWQNQLALRVREGLVVNLIQDYTHEYLLSQSDVAKGYGVSETQINTHAIHKSNNLVEGVHFVTKKECTQLGKRLVKRRYWTKKGIVEVGRLIVSYLAIKFRNWADNITLHVSNGNVSKMVQEKRKYEAELEVLENKMYYLSSENENLRNEVKEMQKIQETPTQNIKQEILALLNKIA